MREANVLPAPNWIELTMDVDLTIIGTGEDLAVTGDLDFREPIILRSQLVAGECVNRHTIDVGALGDRAIDVPLGGMFPEPRVRSRREGLLGRRCGRAARSRAPKVTTCSAAHRDAT